MFIQEKDQRAGYLWVSCDWLQSFFSLMWRDSLVWLVFSTIAITSDPASVLGCFLQTWMRSWQQMGKGSGLPLCNSAASELQVCASLTSRQMSSPYASFFPSSNSRILQSRRSLQHLSASPCNGISEPPAACSRLLLTETQKPLFQPSFWFSLWTSQPFCFELFLPVFLGCSSNKNSDLFPFPQQSCVLAFFSLAMRLLTTKRIAKG